MLVTETDQDRKWVPRVVTIADRIDKTSPNQNYLEPQKSHKDLLI